MQTAYNIHENCLQINTRREKSGKIKIMSHYESNNLTAQILKALILSVGSA